MYLLKLAYPKHVIGSTGTGNDALQFKVFTNMVNVYKTERSLTLILIASRNFVVVLCDRGSLLIRSLPPWAS